MRKVMLDQGEEVGLQWIEMLMLHYCHLVVLYDAFGICRVEDNQMKVQQTKSEQWYVRTCTSVV